MHKVTYANNGVTVDDVVDGQTLLSVSVKRRFPHHHQCGAQARCTTCRFQILEGASHVSPRNNWEREVAAQRGWDDYTRLGCQAKVHGDLVVRLLVDNPQEIIVLDLDELRAAGTVEGKEVQAAILFSDIRNFTTFAERNLPYDVVLMLNQHFTAVTEPVLNNDGFVDKYIGDGILAVFGIREESAETACKNAVRAALLMQDAVERLRPVFESSFNMQLRIGIGIHFGPVILGRMGHPGKRQVTVIGDTVNMASRVENMTKDLDASILVTEAIAERLGGALRLGAAIDATIKGRAGRTLLYPCEGFTQPDTVYLVQKSFEHVSARAREFAERFYAVLFDAHPELRPYFKDDLSTQAMMFASMLTSLVKGLNRFEEIAGGLRELGKRHVADYQIPRSAYVKVAHALLTTLQEYLGVEFTPEVREAWLLVYSQISAIMIDAGEESTVEV
jgi:class 3 adenylate cyclase/hemoglobin-like flavoprotein